ncbi:MAG: MBOAT family protein, partial [Lachnospiraceae bacterium]|nr:MBOAT family protein [Lachnospiraceae bacterium]
EYLLYLLYFPKLAQGPIALPQEMLTQFRNRMRGRLDRDRILRGLLLFIFGLAKKVLYADTLSPLVQQGFAQTDYLDTLTVLLLLITYAFQLYFDFSGYCDMAMGISEMLMIALPVNFDRPFQADGIGDFWKRWHATLSRFFVRYVYIPLGGSRRGGIRTFGNILIIFLLSGLWHGIGATYLLWGAINGLFVALSHGLLSLRKKRMIDGQTTAASKGETSGIRRLFTRVSVFAAFLFTLIFFRAESVGKAVMMLKRLCIPLYPGFLYRIAEHLEFTELYPVIKGITMAFPGSEGIVKLFLWVLLVALGFFLISRRNAWEIAKNCRLTGRLAIGMGLLFAWSVLAFNNVGTFLYFAF